MSIPKRKPGRRGGRFLAASVLLGLLCGCGSSPAPRFYVLSSAPSPAAGGETGGPSVVVLAVELAPYLDRPQLIARTGDNRIELAEFDRWGEPLKEAVQRTLVEDLAAQLGTARVRALATGSARPGERVLSVEISRFERGPDGQVVVAASWSLGGGAAGLAPQVRRSTFRVAVGGDGSYAAVVAAQSAALADLSREIAKELRSSDSETR